MRESRQCIHMVTVLPFARLPLREAQSLNDRLVGKSGMVCRSKVERDKIGSFQRSNTKIVGLIRGASVVIFRAFRVFVWVRVKQRHGAEKVSVSSQDVPDSLKMMDLHGNRLKSYGRKNMLQLQRHISSYMASQFATWVLTMANGFARGEMPSRAGAALSRFSRHSPK